MKILHIAKYYNIIGGIEFVVKNLAEESAKQNHNVTVVSASNNLNKKNHYLNKVFNLQIPCFGTYFSMPITPTLFKYFNKNYDIINLHLPFPLAVISALLSFKKLDNVIVNYYGDIVKQKKIMFFYKPILKYFLSKVKAIVVSNPNLIINSPILKEFKNKCHIIPIGINKNFHKLKNFDNKKQEKPLILSVGRLVYYKGFDILIKSMTDIDANLIIIGDGPLKEHLQNLINSLKLNNKIKLLGFVDDKILSLYYNLCDLYVLSSINKAESFGIVLLEAMSLGKPIISTNIPSGSPYINKHNETGLVVPPNDINALNSAIKKILNNKDLQRKFGKNSKARFQNKFTLKKMIDKTLNLYKKIINL